jgi:3-dehydroquinate synthase
VIAPHRLVRQSSHYPVFVGEGILARAVEVVREMDPEAPLFAVVSQRVAELYANAVETLRGQVSAVVTFPDSEEEKTLARVEWLTTELLRAGAKRDAILLLIGGGVVGDTAGFAASVYLRGVRFVHIPTTLLSQVDSSIGGKVAVNHPLGKNMIGSFSLPLAVLSDASLLGTLPEVEFVSGLVEALKSGVIADERLFSIIEEHGSGLQRMVRPLREIVCRAVDVKAVIVEHDEREEGERKLLNYGHTVGHAIEVAERYRGITHGEAVAWGMIAANAIAVAKGMFSREGAERIDRAALQLRPRPTSVREPETLLAAAGLDKKFSSRGNVMILPRAIGHCEIATVTPDELRLGVEAMLEREESV